MSAPLRRPTTLPPATYRFPLKGQYEVLNPSYSEETCSKKPQTNLMRRPRGSLYNLIVYYNFFFTFAHL
ncbi:hypothetical protein PGJ_00004790 [Porphyromonas gingivalis AJW4]|nr:hypothetical protein PGJ_00004790 [Porphyromonas gingivalis AJW4]